MVVVVGFGTTLKRECFGSFFSAIFSTRECNGCFFKFGVEVGVELSIVNALYRLRITDQLFKP
jgi:hypothetical protein